MKVENNPKGEESQVIYSGKLLVKCGDLGTFFLPCLVSKMKFKHVMLDLESVTPMYSEIQSHVLHSLGILVQLTDCSLVKPFKMIKEVLVRVNGFLFPSNFYILDMHDSTKNYAFLLCLILDCFLVLLFHSAIL